MLLELLLAFALQEPGPGDSVPAISTFPEKAIADKENRTLLVIYQSENQDRKVEVEKLLKESSIRRELQYEFVVAYRAAPVRPDGAAYTSFRFGNPYYPNPGVLYADLLMDNGKPDAAEFLSILRKNETIPWDAWKLLEAARKTALQENKRLFVHLGAPW